MDTVAGHDAELEMRLVLENRRWGGQHDVGEQDILGGQPRRAVHRGNERHFDIEDIHEDLFALAINLVVALRREEVEALGADGLHERVAAASEDDDATVGVRPDRMKKVYKLLMSITIEDQCAAIGVKRHFQHAGFRKGQTSIGKAVAIGIKAPHRISPLAAGSALWLAISWSATSLRSLPTICGCGPTPSTSLPTRLISAPCQPAATAPRVSQVWQAMRQSCEGLTPSSFST